MWTICSPVQSRDVTGIRWAHELAVLHFIKLIAEFYQCSILCERTDDGQWQQAWHQVLTVFWLACVRSSSVSREWLTELNCYPGF